MSYPISPRGVAGPSGRKIGIEREKIWCPYNGKPLKADESGGKTGDVLVYNNRKKGIRQSCLLSTWGACLSTGS